MTHLDQTNWSVDILLTDQEKTENLAMRLRQGFCAGDVVLLSGPIGAGKSCFARALIRSLLADHNKSEDIPSPTFTLVQTYQTGELEIWHSDLYRLTTVNEVVELGLIDAFENALCIVEWPDRLGDEAPKAALMLEFGLCQEENHRMLKITAQSEKWNWVRKLLKVEHA
jgi:tRNA threonylcarbamoyladenosine biosynthesis protein TsaE